MRTTELVEYLSNTGILRTRLWRKLPEERRDEILQASDHPTLLASLEEFELLTRYQAEKIRASKFFGLTLGNYRVLDRIGAGGMGIVYKGEHFQLPRIVAIKTLAADTLEDPALLDRFLFEMDAISTLQHPNIVRATDAGVVRSAHENETDLHYFVMEYVEGDGLDNLVNTEGAIEPMKACDLVYQIASALAEAHRQHFIHRDLKPSNIIVTPDGKAKLLDFGLARGLDSRLTEHGIALGTIDFLPPEQAEDAHSADHRADIFGLGATFFWCLTGKTPFPSKGDVAVDLAARISQPAPSVNDFCPEIPEDLSAVVSKMMELDPNDRYQSANELMRALVPFLKPQSSPLMMSVPKQKPFQPPMSQLGENAPRILIIDDEASIRQVCTLALERKGFLCEQAEDGERGLEKLKTGNYDLALIDVNMPKVSGLQVLDQIRRERPAPHFKVIMISGRTEADELAQLLSAGADDYLVKPLRLAQLTSIVKASLDLKHLQDRVDQLNLNLSAVNRQLERNLEAKDSDLVEARNALVLSLAEMVSSRDSQTGQHLRRIQLYCKVMAEEASHWSEFSDRIDYDFIHLLECCAPLHDLGKVGLPDHILLKPGRLEPDERILMQTHTTIGAETLQRVADQHSFMSGFIQMAVDIARHHHERFDGTGYPDRLAGEAIPLSARFVAIADAYDALRSRRPYKPALSHPVVIQMITQSNEGQFDPSLLQVFEACSQELERIYRDYPD